mgnify:CR=1 FL=1
MKELKEISITVFFLLKAFELAKILFILARIFVDFFWAFSVLAIVIKLDECKEEAHVKSVTLAKVAGQLGHMIHQVMYLICQAAILLLLGGLIRDFIVLPVGYLTRPSNIKSESVHDPPASAPKHKPRELANLYD